MRGPQIRWTNTRLRLAHKLFILYPKGSNVVVIIIATVAVVGCMVLCVVAGPCRKQSNVNADSDTKSNAPVKGANADSDTKSNANDASDEIVVNLWDTTFSDDSE